MKNKDDSAILEIENPTSVDVGSVESLESVGSASQLLQFQDFPRNVDSNVISPQTKQSSASYTMSNDDSASNDDEESDVLLGTSGASNKPQVHAFWELSYFAQYFDVTTSQVLSRIMYSVLPNRSKPNGNYIERHIQSNADFYGPFWINVTLIFTIAIFGNISNYIRHEGSEQSWHYDFHKLGLAASTVFTYTIVVPLILWFFFWFRGCALTYTLFEMICAYGYSISIYIPIAILWISNISLIQYASVIIGALLSGSVLTLSFAPVVHSDPSKTFKTSYVVLLLIVTLHALLAFAFLVYFF
ncbi:protein YIPF1-like isoform X1 [Leptotrombidium deliense]|uniref:Protein YIPF n=1 Tax=Leptotrombidium deliense TaxID=299467 RepID=A0A443SGJ5_9ACAR|nr:protein YIPF1-like isoform X1 [Leptotrombidium deliense]